VDKGVATSLLNKVVKGGSASAAYLRRMGEGLAIILKDEVGAFYDVSEGVFSTNRPAGWLPTYIDEIAKPAEYVPYSFYADGRRSLVEKTEFIAQAQRSVIFMGLRMRQFTNYFFGKRDGEFVDHIKVLLDKGVDIKCYLLDPDSNRAHLFFEDLSEVLPEAINGELIIKDNIRRLLSIQAEMDVLGGAGKFRVFTYRHLPTAHFLMVDGAAPDGRLQVAHYLYGKPSGKVPVLEIYRRDNQVLYDLYASSLEMIIKGATERGIYGEKGQ